MYCFCVEWGRDKSCALDMEAVRASETSVGFYRTALGSRRPTESSSSLFLEICHWNLKVGLQIMKVKQCFSVGRDSSVGIATELWAGWSGDRIPVGTRYSAPVQIGPEAHPVSYYNGYRVFSGG